MATPLEQQMNGVDNMLYMQSTNGNDNTMSLTVTFDVDTDVNTDEVNVQNRVAQAAPNLPPDVNQFGTTIRKSTGLPLIAFGLYSPNHTHDSLFLANYANININDQLLRIPGAGQMHSVWSHRLLDARVVQAAGAGQAGNDGRRPGGGAEPAKYRESGGAAFRESRAAGNGDDLHRSARRGAW